MKDQTLKLEVATPNGLFSGLFAKTAKVIDVIRTIVTEKKLAGGDVFELIFNGASLTPTDRPLVSFRLEDCAKLDLVATGSGV